MSTSNHEHRYLILCEYEYETALELWLDKGL